MRLSGSLLDASEAEIYRSLTNHVCRGLIIHESNDWFGGKWQTTWRTTDGESHR